MLLLGITLDVLGYWGTFWLLRRQWNFDCFVANARGAFHKNAVPSICVALNNASVTWASIGSGNGLSPVRRQAIAWTNAGLLSISLLGTNFSEIRLGILSFSFKETHLKLSSAKMSAILSRKRGVKTKWCTWHHSTLQSASAVQMVLIGIALSAHHFFYSMVIAVWSSYSTVPI